MTIAARRKTRTLEHGVEWRPRHDPHYMLAGIMVSAREAPPICILHGTLRAVEAHLQHGTAPWDHGLLTGQLCYCRRSERAYVLIDDAIPCPPLAVEPDDYAEIAAALAERISELEHAGRLVIGCYRSGARVLPRPPRGEVALLRALFDLPWQTMLIRDSHGPGGAGAFIRIEPMDGQPYAASFRELLPKRGWRHRKDMPDSAVTWTNYQPSEPVREIRVPANGSAPVPRPAPAAAQGPALFRALHRLTRRTPAGPLGWQGASLVPRERPVVREQPAPAPAPERPEEMQVVSARLQMEHAAESVAEVVEPVREAEPEADVEEAVDSAPAPVVDEVVFPSPAPDVAETESAAPAPTIEDAVTAPPAPKVAETVVTPDPDVSRADDVNDRSTRVERAVLVEWSEPAEAEPATVKTAADAPGPSSMPAEPVTAAEPTMSMEAKAREPENGEEAAADADRQVIRDSLARWGVELHAPSGHVTRSERASARTPPRPFLGAPWVAEREMVVPAPAGEAGVEDVAVDASADGTVRGATAADAVVDATVEPTAADAAPAPDADAPRQAPVPPPRGEAGATVVGLPALDAPRRATADFPVVVVPQETDAPSDSPRRWTMGSVVVLLVLTVLLMAAGGVVMRG